MANTNGYLDSNGFYWPPEGTTGGTTQQTSSVPTYQATQAVIPSKMQTDYNNYFNTATPGQTINWGGGTLTKGNVGATYTSADGSTQLLTPTSDLNALASSNPGIASEWGMNYGFSPKSSSPELFQPNLYQSSTSGSNQSSQGNTFSGLDANYRNQIASGTIPQLLQAVSGLNSVPQQTANAATNLYSNMLNQGINSSLQGVLNQLASRGILNSSVASDTLSKTAQDLIQTNANNAYQSQIDSGKMQMLIPNILSSIMGLSSYNQGNTSSTGTSGSYASDPLEPYTMLANFLMNY